MHAVNCKKSKLQKMKAIRRRKEQMDRWKAVKRWEVTLSVRMNRRHNRWHHRHWRNRDSHSGSCGRGSNCGRGSTGAMLRTTNRHEIHNEEFTGNSEKTTQCTSLECEADTRKQTIQQGPEAGSGCRATQRSIKVNR